MPTDKRPAMLGELNEIYNDAYIKQPKLYTMSPGLYQYRVRRVQGDYPEEFSKLQEENTDAKIAYLNQIDFDEGVTRKGVNNPMANLGARGANTSLRVPFAWADQSIPIEYEGEKEQALGYYNRTNDNLVIPVSASRPNIKKPERLGTNGNVVVEHELMHRGIDKLPENQRPKNESAEHNYIFNKVSGGVPAKIINKYLPIDDTYKAADDETRQRLSSAAGKLYDTYAANKLK